MTLHRKDNKTSFQTLMPNIYMVKSSFYNVVSPGEIREWMDGWQQNSSNQYISPWVKMALLR